MSDHSRILADIARTYDACHGDFADFTARTRSSGGGLADQDRFVASLPPGADVLDLGFGSGWDLEYFSARGCRVAGVDISARQVAALRERLPDATLIEGDICRAEELFPAESFDGVWARAAIVHMDIEAGTRVIRSMERLLRHKGRGYCSTKIRRDATAPALVEKASVSSGWIVKRYSYWLESELSSAIEAAGLRIESVSVSSMNS